MIDSYKLAIIYGKEDNIKNIKDGQIEMRGNAYDFDVIHIKCLLDFAKERYPEVEIFKRLNYKHTPEIASYFLTLLDNIVFLNTTKDIEKYGKTGIFMMPKTFSEMQIDTLISFTENLKDYSISICYDLELVDGILESKELHSLDKKQAIKLLETYLQKENRVIKSK